MVNSIYHVVPHQNEWAVKREGNEQASRVLPDQDEAIAQARAFARNQAPSRIVIHGPDGAITAQESVASRSPRPGRSSRDAGLSQTLASPTAVVAMVAAVGAIAAVGTIWLLDRRDALPDVPSIKDAVARLR
jgi:hypothetical protein